jgi:hypothetical protein
VGHGGESLDVQYTARGLDHTDKLHAMAAPVYLRCELLQFANALELRHHDAVDGHLESGREIRFCMARTGRVGPDEKLCIQFLLAQRGDGCGQSATGIVLLRFRHRILQVNSEGVGGIAGKLSDQLRSVCGSE